MQRFLYYHFALILKIVTSANILTYLHAEFEASNNYSYGNNATLNRKFKSSLSLSRGNFEQNPALFLVYTEYCNSCKCTISAFQIQGFGLGVDELVSESGPLFFFFFTYIDFCIKTRYSI